MREPEQVKAAIRAEIRAARRRMSEDEVRERSRAVIARLSPEIPDLYEHLASGMREGSLGELWPATKTRDEMKETYLRYMGKSAAARADRCKR